MAGGLLKHREVHGSDCSVHPPAAQRGRTALCAGRSWDRPVFVYALMSNGVASSADRYQVLFGIMAGVTPKLFAMSSRFDILPHH